VSEQKEKDLFPQNARLAQLSDSLLRQPERAGIPGSPGNSCGAQELIRETSRHALYRRFDALAKEYAQQAGPFPALLKQAALVTLRPGVPGSPRKEH